MRRYAPKLPQTTEAYLSYLAREGSGNMNCPDREDSAPLMCKDLNLTMMLR